MIWYQTKLILLLIQLVIFLRIFGTGQSDILWGIKKNHDLYSFSENKSDISL